MIGDLSNAPEPIQIKIFSTDAALLQKLGPQVGDAISKVSGVVDAQNGIENTISGPATNFQVDRTVAGRLGFTPTEVAEDATYGIEATVLLIANGRPYTIRLST
jgi:Cu/Ag efflux pump CusA